MNKYSMNIITVLTLLFCVACGGAKVALLSSADINKAKDNGNLESLYNKLTQTILESRGKTKRDNQAIQLKVAQLLTQERLSLVDSTLENKNQEFGLVSRSQILNLIAKTANMKKWSINQYNSVKIKLDRMLIVTNKKIKESVDLAVRNKNDIVTQMKWMRKASILAGSNQPENEGYTQKLTENIAIISKRGRDAYSRRMYNLSLSSAEDGLAIDPGNIQFESLLSQSQAALFEQEFRTALENGKPELAYQAFIKIADKPIMLQIRKKMERSILVLANYFASNAKKSYQKNNLLNAYLEFQRARDVQKKLSLPDKAFIQEKRFLDLLMKKSAFNNTTEGKKYALYNVIYEFDKNYPGLEKKMASTLEKISQRATTKLSISEFREVPSTNSVVSSVGRRVSSKLEKILFKALSNELQIVTSTSLLQQKDYSGGVLTIHGEVLQATVISNTNPGQRIVHVQTGIKKTETPAYTKWKKRKRGKAPTQYIEEKISQDVILKVGHIEKQAVVEVAYRIVESSSQKVLLTDNIVKEIYLKGDSINELQQGQFHQAYVAADLPSDIKIMDQLTTDLSQQLGQSLSNYLSNPEKVFQQKYTIAMEQGEASSAIEMLANAVVLAKKKEADFSVWLAVLKKQALQVK